jgi:hypothetical protein
LKGLNVFFGSGFLSGNMDWVIAMLAFTVMLVSSGGASDLVELGSVAICAFFASFP